MKTFREFTDSIQKEYKNQKKKAKRSESNPENKEALCNCDPIEMKYPY
jgi:hypothetical protein